MISHNVNGCKISNCFNLAGFVHVEWADIGKHIKWTWMISSWATRINGYLMFCKHRLHFGNIPLQLCFIGLFFTFYVSEVLRQWRLPWFPSCRPIILFQWKDNKNVLSQRHTPRWNRFEQDPTLFNRRLQLSTTRRSSCIGSCSVMQCAAGLNMYC